MWLQSWQPPTATQIRIAGYLLFGSLLVWHLAATQIQRTGAALCSLSISFNAASQTGAGGAARSAVAGFVAGLLHTLAGADHLAALTPLTIGRSPLRASLLGSLWGFGHSTGQLLLGLGMVLLKERFDAFLPALSRWGNTAVGASLVVIGAMGLYEVWQEKREQSAAAESAPQFAMEGGPSQQPTASSSIDRDADDGGRLGLGLFGNGILFGLQPDALFVIVPALALPTRLAAIGYISMFVFGTVAAMGGYTAVIGATSQAIQERNPWLTTNLSVLASCVAVVIGAIVLTGAA